jgi:UDP:flavonoid glycosyltransferase YjiC (YdhE family)
LTAAQLGDAIATVLNDQTMRKRATDVGERVRAENGLKRAADIIEERLRT